MDTHSQPEKYKRIFARRLAEECEARQWPADQWQKRLKEITGASQATVSRWLNGESIPHPVARQALSREFDKLDSYWLGGKTEQEIQTDAGGGSIELKESPYEATEQGTAAAGPRLPDYTVFASPVLKRMLKELIVQLNDTPDPHAGPVLDQIEMIAVTLRAKLHRAAEARRQKEIPRAQV